MDVEVALRLLWMARTYAGPTEKFDHRARFDQWLAEVKAKAFDQGVTEAIGFGLDSGGFDQEAAFAANPYRKEQ